MGLTRLHDCAVSPFYLNKFNTVSLKKKNMIVIIIKKILNFTLPRSTTNNESCVKC